MCAVHKYTTTFDPRGSAAPHVDPMHYEAIWWVGVMATRQFPELKILGSSPRPVAFFFFFNSEK